MTNYVIENDIVTAYSSRGLFLNIQGCVSVFFIWVANFIANSVFFYYIQNWNWAELIFMISLLLTSLLILSLFKLKAYDEFDLEVGAYRKGVSYFGHKFGKFKNADDYNQCCIFNRAYKQQLTYKSIGAETGFRLYTLVLLNENHAKRIEFFESEKREDVDKLAEEFVKTGKFIAVSYNPPGAKYRRR